MKKKLVKESLNESSMDILIGGAGGILAGFTGLVIGSFILALLPRKELDNKSYFRTIIDNAKRDRRVNNILKYLLDYDEIKDMAINPDKYKNKVWATIEPLLKEEDKDYLALITRPKLSDKYNR